MTYTQSMTFNVCGCCLLKLANDDTSGHDYYCTGDPEPLNKLADFEGILAPGDDSEGHFSRWECEGCGALPGQRYELVGLVEHAHHPITAASIARMLEDG